MEKAIWKNSNAEQKVVLWTILMMVYHDENEWIWQGQKFKTMPGEMVTSLQKISDNAGVSIQSVRSALKKFEKLEFLTYESTRTGRLIKVINWSIYQADNETPNKAINKEPTKSQQRANKEPTTTKNNKNDNNDKNEKNKDVSKKFFDDSIQLILAKKLYELILVNDSKAKEPNLQKWASDIDKMIRIDNRSPQEIESLIKFAQASNFWKANILSASKLREKATTLSIQMKDGGRNGTNGYVTQKNTVKSSFNEYADL